MWMFVVGIAVIHGTPREEESHDGESSPPVPSSPSSSVSNLSVMGMDFFPGKLFLTISFH